MVSLYSFTLPSKTSMPKDTHLGHHFSFAESESIENAQLQPWGTLPMRPTFLCPLKIIMWWDGWEVGRDWEHSIQNLHLDSISKPAQEQLGACCLQTSPTWPWAPAPSSPVVGSGTHCPGQWVRASLWGQFASTSRKPGQFCSGKKPKTSPNQRRIRNGKKLQNILLYPKVCF